MTNMIVDPIGATIEREGGFTDRSDDRGGPTKFGITAATLGESRKLGRPATSGEVRDLTEDEAREIFEQRYLEAPGFLRLGMPVVEAVVFDLGVLTGPPTAAKMLQRAAGVKDDGIMGPVTIGAAHQFNQRSLARLVLWQAVRYLGYITTHSRRDADHDNMPDNAEMISGWDNRVAAMGEAIERLP